RGAANNILPISASSAGHRRTPSSRGLNRTLFINFSIHLYSLDLSFEQSATSHLLRLRTKRFWRRLYVRRWLVGGRRPARRAISFARAHDEVRLLHPHANAAV